MRGQRFVTTMKAVSHANVAPSDMNSVRITLALIRTNVPMARHHVTMGHVSISTVATPATVHLAILSLIQQMFFALSPISISLVQVSDALILMSVPLAHIFVIRHLIVTTLTRGTDVAKKVGRNSANAPFRDSFIVTTSVIPLYAATAMS